jgi:hypothetical protein
VGQSVIKAARAAEADSLTTQVTEQPVPNTDSRRCRFALCESRFPGFWKQSTSLDFQFLRPYHPALLSGAERAIWRNLIESSLIRRLFRMPACLLPSQLLKADRQCPK